MESRIFSILVLCCSVQEFSAQNYRKKASNIRKTVGDLLVQFNKFQTVVDNSLANSQPIDFGIKTNARVGQVQDMLIRKAGKPGLEDCQSKFDNGKESVQKDFQNIVMTKLKEQSDNLKQYVANLTYIQNRLFGTALEEELHGCPKCKVQREFSRKAFDSGNFVTDHMTELTSKQLPSLYAKKYVDPGKQKIIDDQIFDPVNACLANIK